MGELVLIRGPSKRERIEARLDELGEERDTTQCEIRELERQFVDNDLVVLYGKRAGQPLAPGGRRSRMHKLAALRYKEFALDIEIAERIAERNSLIDRATGRAIDRYLDDGPDEGA